MANNDTMDNLSWEYRSFWKWNQNIILNVIKLKYDCHGYPPPSPLMKSVYICINNIFIPSIIHITLDTDGQQPQLVIDTMSILSAEQQLNNRTSTVLKFVYCDIIYSDLQLSRNKGCLPIHWLQVKKETHLIPQWKSI